jgi:cell division protein FtsB
MIFANKVDSLQKKSDNIFNVFNKTLNELQKVNEQISDEEAKREAEIARIQDEKDALAATKQANEKMIGKLNAFIND